MGFFDGLKGRMISGRIYTLYEAKRSRFPKASVRDLLAETCYHRFNELRKKYPDLPEMSLDRVRQILIEDEIRDLDTLVDFLIGFEERAAELHK